MTQDYILLVDDNAAHRTLVKRAVRKAGVQLPIVEMASTAEVRKSLLGDEQEKKPVLGILDLNLGNDRSTSLVREIRASARLGSLPIMVLSTSPLENDMFESYAVGANCYLIKADDVTIFTKEIESAVKFLLALPD